MTSRLAAYLLVPALCLRAAPALAQSEFDRTTARTLGREGHTALDQRDYAAAADRFKRADALVHAPTFLLGYAQASVGLGKLVAALEAYNRILREGVEPKAPPPFVKALETARAEFDALQPRIPYVTIQVNGAAAASAKVTVDGVEVPRAALGVKRAIDPGTHTIVASADGFEPATAPLTIAEGRSETVTLEPLAAPHAVSAGVGVAPVQAPVDTKRRTIGIVGMAAGGAGLAVGAILGGVVLAKHSALTASCPGGKCPSSEQSTLGPKVDQYHTFTTGSTVAFAVGGVLAAAGIVVFVTAPRAPATVGVSLGPAWAGLEGSFR